MSTVPQYLIAIYGLAVTEGEPVGSGAVADELGRSPSTTTEMLQRLDDEGLVVYEAYKGVWLTDEGRKRGETLHRRYLVFRQFFGDILGVADPDTEARELAAVISPVVADRLAATVLGVDDPSADGHRSASADVDE